MTCPRTGKWIGGCRFEARYDRGPADTTGIGRIAHYIADAPKMLQACQQTIYIHDICVVCGKIVEKTKGAIS